MRWICFCVIHLCCWKHVADCEASNAGRVVSPRSGLAVVAAKLRASPRDLRGLKRLWQVAWRSGTVCGLIGPVFEREYV
jgi:hypothetical protein